MTTGEVPPGRAARAVDEFLAGVRQWPGVEVTAGLRAGEHVLVVPGERKLRTTVAITAGGHSVRVVAFVVRHPDENRERFFHWLLARNARLHGAAFLLDGHDDVYLAGALPAETVTAGALDALVGEVAREADASFDRLLELGFLTSIRAEWDWRRARGESTRNLDAFRHLLDG